MRIHGYKNGACASMEKLFPSGMYLVQVRTPSGELHDKIRLDDYRQAMSYFKAFKAIAKGF